MKPFYDVIAKIPGSAHPDEWVIRGNHHDAWVNGAEDPISGMVTVLEEARSMGELLKQGWKPKRTIIYCAWDGEEPGLLGSTEWVETHVDELRKHAVMYVNSDSNSRGYLGMEGSHTLEHFINDVARDIQDPETKLSVWKRAQLKGIADASSADERRELRERHDMRWKCWVAGRTMRHSSTLPALPRSVLDMAARITAASIIPSTTIFTGIRTLATMISCTAARWPKPVAP